MPQDEAEDYAAEGSRERAAQEARRRIYAASEFGGEETMMT